MRLGLIGSTGHWQTYAPALHRIDGMSLAAVAAVGPEETTGAFDHAPGLTVDTHRYDDAKKMLNAERLDVVQVCARVDRGPGWVRACLERGLPVIAVPEGGVRDHLRDGRNGIACRAGDVSGMALANGLALIPDGDGLEAGDPVDVMLLA